MMESEFSINTPINYDVVKKYIVESGLKNVGKASIREIRSIINNVEKETGDRYIRMEMGVPGLKTPSIAIEAEIEALRNGVSALYPEIGGLDDLKTEISRFIKNFTNIDISSRSCFPTVGSVNGSYIVFMVTGKMDPKKDTILFIDPGFPVHKQIVKMLGLKQDNFDVYEYRGDKLRDKLESHLAKGNVSTILYCNPNNPTWICFTEKELEIIGDLANKYDVVVAEDLAYFGMDFRRDISKPGEPPYQVSVANYTDNYVLLISSSKAFSYAGQRIGMLAISDKLFDSRHDNLLNYFSTNMFGYSVLYGVIYGTSAGISHSSQYGLLALLRAVNNGDYNYFNDVKEYAEKAGIMKKMFTDNGFYIVYDKDEDNPIADGFYFTVCYPGFTGEELIEELLYYGISAISLAITGSQREGIRACVSLVRRDQFPALEERLKIFRENHAL